MSANIIRDNKRRDPCWWAFLAEGEPVRLNRSEVSEGVLVDGDLCRFADKRVVLVKEHPLVGRTARWGNGAYVAIVRAVIRIDSEDKELLLEDWTGYPWVREPMDAELLPVLEKQP